MEQRRRTASKFFPVYQPALNLDFRSGNLPPEITFSRASTATFVGSNGLIQTAAANQPRFAYDPVTLAAKNLQLECEARTNLILRSDDISNAAWTKTRSSTPGTATTAPDGTATGYKLVEDATAANTHDIRQVVVNGALVTYTQSIFVKKDTREWIYFELYNTAASSNRARAWFNANTGVIGVGSTVGAGITYVSHKIENYGNGWYRCSMVAIAEAAVANVTFFTGMATADGSSNYNGDGVSGLYLWGADLEVGSFASSHMPTVAASTTRAADVCNVSGANLARVLNPWGGTLAWSGSLTQVGTDQRLFELNDNTGVNLLHLRNTSGAVIRAAVITGGVTQAAQNTVNGITGNTRFRTAISYTTNYCVDALDSGEVVTDTPPFAVPTVSQLQLMTGVAGTQPAFGFVDYLRYWQQDCDPKMVQFLTSTQYAA